MLLTADDLPTLKKDNVKQTLKKDVKQTPTKVPKIITTTGNQQAKDAGVVKYLIGKTQTPERLLELLQLGDPTFKEEDLQNPDRRQKAWRKVVVLIHPDHNKESDATQLFQDSQNWYSTVCRSVKKATPEKISEFPVAACEDNYGIFEEYPHLKHWHPWRNTSGVWSEEFWAAVACINLRGACAFKKCPEISFSLSQLLEFAQDIQPATTNMVADTHDIFKKFGGCRKMEYDEAEMKKHIRTKGPVVSLSFKPSAAVIDQFPEIDVELGCTNTVVIVGWKTNVYGQSWTVYLPSTARSFDIAFGQCSITENIVYPGKNMEKFSWEPGPYFPIDMSKWDADFRSWTHFSIHLSKERFKEFFARKGKGRIIQKCNAEYPVVLRDMSVNAKTVKVQVSDFEYDPNCILAGRPYTIHLIPM